MGQAEKRVAQVSHRFANVRDKPDEGISYLDANSLYGGYAMSLSLPVEDGKPMTRWELDNGDFIFPADMQHKGCALVVDLVFPKCFHSFFNDLVPRPELLILPGGKFSKLICHLNKRTKYPIFFRHLHFVLSLGVKLTKIHSGLSFRMKPFMKGYSEINVNRRNQARAEKDLSGSEFYKLANNAVYGKTIEDVSKRTNILLKTSDEELTKYSSKPNFKGRTIFSEDLVALHMESTSILFDKPIYIGCIILEEAKLLLWRFWYSLKKIFKDNIKLIFTDTDLVCFHVKRKFWENLSQEVLDQMDLSGLPPDHPFQDSKNKGVVGKMRVEDPTMTIQAAVALRPKMYFLQMEEWEDGVLKAKKDEKKAKGVPKSAAKKFSFFDYMEGMGGVDKHVHVRGIRSFDHQIKTLLTKQKALPSAVDKMYICKDRIHCLAWRHKDIKKV